MSDKHAWLLFDDAYKFAYGIEDLAKRQFVLLGLYVLRLNLARREKPAADFDLLFFAKALSELFDTPAMRAILRGEDLRWPDDDDVI